MRNVEFLGMRLELKASLGRYYRQWLKPSLRKGISPDIPMDDSEDEGSGSEGNYSETSLSGSISSGSGRQTRAYSPRPSPTTTPESYEDES